MKLLNLVASSLFSLSASLLLFTTASFALPFYGCKTGTVCIYKGNALKGEDITNRYIYYGVSKLYNQYNIHAIFNNQTDGAVVLLCTDSNGSKCPYKLDANHYDFVDLTPYNSIVLERLSTQKVRLL